MKTNTNSKYLIAVLIDGDNVSFERMEDIMGFVSRYGDAVIRRIYGDWTRKALSGCLVASDGDYNPLAQRIREAGLKVLGYGEGKTPVSLIRSCSVFLYADRKENKTLENTPDFFIRRDMEFFDKAFQQAADGKEEVSLSLIGGSLKKMMPKFKVKRYGCKTLGKLYERLERYELVMTEKGVASAVRMKGRAVRQE